MSKSLLTPRVKSTLSKLKPREAVLLVAALAIGVGMGVYSYIIEPAAALFEAQKKEFKALTDTSEVAPSILARYLKVAERRKEIEQFYDKVDIRVDPLTHLEKLLREVARVAPGSYTVSPRDGLQLAGGRYAHKIFMVKFETASLENLTDFLRVVTEGQQPMLISLINLEKRPTSESLMVQIEVSGFEAVTKS